ncbi:MAG: glycosyltransferase family 2 protein [Gammaproteobacteria bacterium]|nr:glycosyltransferase family 2 protein [Gammaproteobacteria bacterium]
MAKVPVSVFIIARDEADRIGTTIRSVRDWADEVVVVDSGSHDQTVTVSRDLGATTHYHAWAGYGPQKVYAESLCRNAWVLNLDADEEATPELGAAIVRLFERGEPPCSGYLIRLVELYGPEARDRPWLPKVLRLRLYRKDRAGFRASAVHDSVVVREGSTGRIDGLILHRSFRSCRHRVAKMNDYSDAQAEDRFRAGRRPSVPALLLTVPLAFLKAYVVRRAFLYGVDGITMSWMYAFHRLLRLAKTRERFRHAALQHPDASMPPGGPTPADGNRWTADAEASDGERGDG